MTTDEQIALEKMIDTHTLADVVETLATICREKQEHILTNWQDVASAKCWNEAARLLDAIPHKLGGL